MNEKTEVKKMNELLFGALLGSKSKVEEITISNDSMYALIDLDNTTSLSIECENGATKMFLMTKNKIEEIFDGSVKTEKI